MISAQTIRELAGWSLGAMVAAGGIYSLAAAVLTAKALKSASHTPASRPGVTLIKPVHGAPEWLAEALASFCRQDYQGPLQVVFGAHQAEDPAVGVVRALQGQFPDANIELVIDGQLHGANRKTSNLINIASAAKNAILIISDADIVVEPGYVEAVVAALESPGVGLVTCPYVGREVGGLWSRLSAMGINYRFTPSAILGKAIGLAEPCFGATMALRAETLRQVGGFVPFADHLADDYEIGRAVRDLGARIAWPTLAVTHMSEERTARQLVTRELRSARTVRQIDPWGYAGSVVTHPLPLALIASALLWPSWIGGWLIAGALAARLILKLTVDRAARQPVGPWWLLPVSDLLSFGLFIASFMVNSVGWHGTRFRVSRQGALVQS